MSVQVPMDPMRHPVYKGVNGDGRVVMDWTRIADVANNAVKRFSKRKKKGPKEADDRYIWWWKHETIIGRSRGVVL